MADPGERFDVRNVSKYLAAPETFVRRTLARYTEDADGCWLYDGSTTRDGYAQANYKTGGRQFAVYVHVLAYQLERGDLADGMEIDHLCHDPDVCTDLRSCKHRRCLNPGHLAQVTGDQNRRRTNAPPTLNRRKTHCPQGHAYDSHEGTGRRCSTCRRGDKQRQYERHGATDNAKRAEKMRTDPSYRERRLAASRLRSKALAGARRERYATDPEYRERIKRAARERYQRIKAGEQ